jgi:hypothetical protein
MTIDKKDHYPESSGGYHYAIIHPSSCMFCEKEQEIGKKEILC